MLIVDDLVDTGKTAKVVRDMLPEAHFATVYAKPMGRPLVDTFITEVSQDTWILFSLGHRARVPAADPRRRQIAARADLLLWRASSLRHLSATCGVKVGEGAGTFGRRFACMKFSGH